MDVAHAVRQARGLLRERARDRGVGVARGRHAEGGRAVDERVAVDVAHERARARFPKDGVVVGEVGDAPRFAQREVVRERARTRPRNRGDDRFELAAHPR